MTRDEAVCLVNCANQSLDMERLADSFAEMGFGEPARVRPALLRIAGVNSVEDVPAYELPAESPAVPGNFFGPRPKKRGRPQGRARAAESEQEAEESSTGTEETASDSEGETQDSSSSSIGLVPFADGAASAAPLAAAVFSRRARPIRHTTAAKALSITRKD